MFTRTSLLLLPCSIAVLTAFSIGEAQESRLETRFERGAVYGRKWPKKIPFSIDPQFNEYQKNTIRAGVKSIMENTCIDYEETDEPIPKLIYRLSDICYSDVGDTRWGKNQVIQLEGGCANMMPTIQHETMHSLGIDHTHVRHDRDEYVQYNESNVREGLAENFVKLEKDYNPTYDVPYDIGSILHYAQTQGSRIGDDVLTAKDPSYEKSMRSQIYLAFSDWKLVNAHYNCHESCDDQGHINCQNSGFRNPRNCRKCVCPKYYTGDFCQDEVAPIILKPGETRLLTYTAPEGIWRSGVPILNEEIHVVKAPEGQKIRVTILFAMTRRSPYDQTCAIFGVNIADRDLITTGKRFCYNSANSQYTFISKTNVVGYIAFSGPGTLFNSNVTFSIEGGSTEPTITTLDPTTVVTLPSTSATETSTKATEPSTKATESSTQATELSTRATETSTKTTEPSTIATEPLTKSTEPSTQATATSTHFTQPSAETLEPFSRTTISDNEPTMSSETETTSIPTNSNTVTENTTENEFSTTPKQSDDDTTDKSIVIETSEPSSQTTETFTLTPEPSSQTPQTSTLAHEPFTTTPVIETTTSVIEDCYE